MNSCTSGLRCVAFARLVVGVSNFVVESTGLIPSFHHRLRVVTTSFLKLLSDLLTKIPLPWMKWTNDSDIFTLTYFVLIYRLHLYHMWCQRNQRSQPESVWQGIQQHKCECHCDAGGGEATGRDTEVDGAQRWLLHVCQLFDK